MRIVHLFHALDPAEGGTFRVMMNMAISTASLGHKVEVWTPSIPDENASDVRTLRDAVRVVHKPGPQGMLGKGVAGRFKDDLKGVDVLHVHALWRGMTAQMVGAAKARGVRTILTMHGMLMQYPMSMKSLKKRLYLATVAKRLLRDVDVVQMLNSEESRQSRLTGANYRFVEIPNGVDATQFSALPSPGAYRSQTGSLSDKLIMLSMGRLHPIKGCTLLLGAFLDLAEAHDDIALVMAGPDEGSLPELERMLDGNPATERVMLPGLVHGETRLAMLADADIFAQCSLHETASMSILEAAYARKPLLLTDRCNYPEFVSADTGESVPTTREGIREGLARMLDRRRELEAMGERARVVVDQQFLHTTIMDRLIDVYGRLAGGERFPELRDHAG